MRPSIATFVPSGPHSLITETIMSPHGTGMAGLNYYDSLKSFEERFGKNYKRLKNKSH